MVQIAEDAGAHSAFLIQPFFSTPDQEGLYLYYKAVAEGTKLPWYSTTTPRGLGSTWRRCHGPVTDEVPNYVGLKQSNIDEFPEAVRRLSGKIKVMPKSEHHILFGFAFGSPWCAYLCR